MKDPAMNVLFFIFWGTFALNYNPNSWTAFDVLKVTFGTICFKKDMFWMSISSDWSLKERIPMFVLKSSTISEQKMIYKTGANMFKQWEIIKTSLCLTSSSKSPPHCEQSETRLPTPFQKKSFDQRFLVFNFDRAPFSFFLHDLLDMHWNVVIKYAIGCFELSKVVVIIVTRERTESFFT